MKNKKLKIRRQGSASRQKSPLSPPSRTTHPSPTLAVLKIGGSQHLVREGTELEVPHVFLEEGKKKEAEVTLLEPKLAKGKAILKLLEHKKGPKITIMKYKAKSRYRRKRGFRASLSRVLVEKIS